MGDSKRKFHFTKALYVMIWVWFGFICTRIIFSTLVGLHDVDWRAYGFIYDGCGVDYMEAVSLFFLALAFKKNKKEDSM